MGFLIRFEKLIFAFKFSLSIILSNMSSKVSTYLKESYDELLHKVSWPTWSELQQSTAIVLIATILLTAVVWLMDLASSSVLKFIYSLFK